MFDKRLLFFLSLLLGSLFVSAQPVAPKKYQLSSIGFELSSIADVYQKMDMQTMRDFTKNPELLSRNLDGFEEELYRSSEGTKVEANFSFIPYNFNKNEYDDRREIRIGLMYSEREPLIEYYEPYGYGSKGIIYCALIYELDLRIAYLLKGRIENFPRLTYHAGVDVSLGTTINDKILIMEDIYEEEVITTEEYYDAKSSMFSRLNIPLGFEYLISNRVGIGLEAVYGLGLQSVVGGQTYFIPVHYSIGGRVSYHLKKIDKDL